MVDTIKFSEMTDGGNINNNDKVPGLLTGGNVLFNNPWTFLPPGTTAQRPTPSIVVNYRLRFNTDEQLYEYYDATLGAWTQLQENTFTAGPFVTYTTDSSLPGAQNLGALANGILHQTIASGIATLDILAIPLVGTYGGTGVNNSGKTITLGGSLITAGAFNTTFNFTGNTNVIFPTSGTLATTSGSSGVINPGITNEIAYYAADGTTLSGSFTLPIAVQTNITELGTITVGVWNAGGVTSSGAVIAGASLESGSPLGGFSGKIQLFPVTPAKGFLQWAATDNAGNFEVGFTNASFAQATIITVPDPGVSATNFILGDFPGNQVINSGLINLTLVNFVGTGAGLTISDQLINSDSSINIVSNNNEEIFLTASGGMSFTSNSSISIINPVFGAVLGFYDVTGTNAVFLRAGSPPSTVDFTLPPSNVTNGILQSDSFGNWSLTITPAGLSSIGVGNFNISGSVISGSGVVSLESITSGNSMMFLNNNSSFDFFDSSHTISPSLRLFNAAGTNATGFKSGNPVSTTVYTLPMAFPSTTQAFVSSNTGVMSFQALTSGTVTSIIAGTNLTGGTITTSGTIALNPVITGLTSIAVGDISISGDVITGSNGVLIQSTGSGESIDLSPKGIGPVRLFSQDTSNAVPLEFFNSANTFFVALKAGTLTGNTTFTLPTSDVAGLMGSNGSGALSLRALTNGQLFIGATGSQPTAATLTQGTGVAITNASGSITIAATAISSSSFIRNCALVFASTTTLSIKSGSAADSTGLVLITSAGYTLNFATNGANGLDTGSLGASKIYSIWLIRKSSDGTTASLGSLGTSAPTLLPSGYDQYRRIGWWVSTPGSTLENLIQTGINNDRTYSYYNSINQVLNGGNATTYTDIDCSALVPTGCYQVNFSVISIGVLITTAALVFLKNADLSIAAIQHYNANATGATSECVPLTLSATQKFSYKVGDSSVSAYINLLNFIDYV